MFILPTSFNNLAEEFLEMLASNFERGYKELYSLHRRIEETHHERMPQFDTIELFTSQYLSPNTQQGSSCGYLLQLDLRLLSSYHELPSTRPISRR